MRKKAILSMLVSVAALASWAQSALDFRRLGEDTLQKTHQAFYLPSSKLYADEIALQKEGNKPGGPAFMWGCGVQLSALTAAAKADRARYLPFALEYANALDQYWNPAPPTPGYDVLPLPKPVDRYYDDNAWVVLGLCEAYELTGERAFLDKAKATFAYVISGQDEKLGGGIYWRESDKKSKNTCSNAPSACAALRLYQLTKDKTYLQTGKTLYAWTRQKLQDEDGLYLDNIALDGKLEKTKWSYNSGLMIRAGALLFEITGQKSYLKEAQRVAKASVKRWAGEKALKDESQFAHLLADSLLSLYERDHDKSWLQTVQNGAAFLHDHARDARGFYGKRWDKIETPLTRVRLIDMASAARVFWRLCQVQSSARSALSADPAVSPSR